MSMSVALNSVNAFLPMLRSTMATCAGSTAFRLMPSGVTWIFASSTKVETASRMVLRTSAFTFALNMDGGPKDAPS